ncbi:MAG: Uncharacterised protein [Flavobacteriia bacterium]|nr:MAG: Uncharacterised protein [Flavobacteriia bacterium]
MVSIKVLDAQKLQFGTALFFPVDAPMAPSIPPLSLRGALYEKEYWGVETGLSWYRMAGLSADGLPFALNKTLTGPFNSFVLPLQIKGVWPVGRWSIETKFGVFLALNSPYSIRQDHLAEGLVQWSGDWRAMQTKAEIGQGNTFGGLGTLCVKAPLFERVELACSFSWYEGRSPAPITGNAVGVSMNDVPVDLSIDLPDVQLDYRGFEWGLGIEYNWE